MILGGAWGLFFAYMIVAACLYPFLADKKKVHEWVEKHNAPILAEVQAAEIEVERLLHPVRDGQDHPLLAENDHLREDKDFVNLVSQLVEHQMSSAGSPDSDLLTFTEQLAPENTQQVSNTEMQSEKAQSVPRSEAGEAEENAVAAPSREMKDMFATLSLGRLRV